MNFAQMLLNGPRTKSAKPVMLACHTESAKEEWLRVMAVKRHKKWYNVFKQFKNMTAVTPQIVNILGHNPSTVHGALRALSRENPPVVKNLGFAERTGPIGKPPTIWQWIGPEF